MTSATAHAGPLSSDHINYLILRYLQEAGHEASATAFYRDWRRPAGYNDPEDLPFANSVQRHELVSVIQDGLYHDELLARVRKEGRRFTFTTNGAGNGSRPGTAGKGKGRLDQMRRGTEDFPTPPPKRQRRSEEGPHERQVNGAAEPMEVDAVSPSAGDAEDDAEGVSPAVQTPEPEIIEVHERYDSMDVAVQTEGKSGPKTSTIHWRISEPNATILHNTFSPAKGSRVLFTAGEGLSQFYEVPSDLESSADKISRLDDAITGAGSVVTACEWHPQGHAMAFAVDMAREIGVGGKQERRQVIKSHDVRSLRSVEYHSPPLLEPQGIALALRYNWDGSRLLAIRTNGSRGTVEVWNTTADDSGVMTRGADVEAWHIFEGRILDAVWIGHSDFIVSGDEGLLQKFNVRSDQTNRVYSEGHTTTSARTHGLEASVSSNLPEQAQQLSFDRIRVSVANHRVSSLSGLEFVATASEDRMMIQGSAGSDGIRVASASPTDERITALAFSPFSSPTVDSDSAPSESVLAVAREDGYFTIQNLSRDSKAQTRAACQLVDRSPALALAWSPEGSYLAVSGVDVVQIWETLPLVDPNQRSQSTRGLAPDPIVTWRHDKSKALKGLRNGEHPTNGTAKGDGEEPLLEPSLSWSSDGESLALAVGKEIAVIRFRPPLHDGRGEGTTEVNGHGS